MPNAQGYDADLQVRDAVQRLLRAASPQAPDVLIADLEKQALANSYIASRADARWDDLSEIEKDIVVREVDLIARDAAVRARAVEIRHGLGTPVGSSSSRLSRKGK